MIKWLQTLPPLVRVSTLSYVGFCTLAPLGFITHRWLGDFATVALLSVFFWPYPLLLSFQSWIDPTALAGVLADVFGVIVVFVFSSYVQRFFGEARPTGWHLYALGLWMWYVPLLMIQLVVYGVAYFAGLPVGE